MSKCLAAIAAALAAIGCASPGRPEERVQSPRRRSDTYSKPAPRTVIVWTGRPDTWERVSSLVYDMALEGRVSKAVAGLTRSMDEDYRQNPSRIDVYNGIPDRTAPSVAEILRGFIGAPIGAPHEPLGIEADDWLGAPFLFGPEDEPWVAWDSPVYPRVWEGQMRRQNGSGR